MLALFRPYRKIGVRCRPETHNLQQAVCRAMRARGNCRNARRMAASPPKADRHSFMSTRPRERQAEDAPRATRDYRATEEAVRLRTEKLRAKRLAREATVKGKVLLS